MKLWILMFSALLVVSCDISGWAEERAYSDIISELEDNGNPTGMFGAKWNMTQNEIAGLFQDLERLDADTLLHERSLYGRPVLASYH
jgi:hypothetical protein